MLAISGAMGSYFRLFGQYCLANFLADPAWALSPEPRRGNRARKEGKKGSKWERGRMARFGPEPKVLGLGPGPRASSSPTIPKGVKGRAKWL